MVSVIKKWNTEMSVIRNNISPLVGRVDRVDDQKSILGKTEARKEFNKGENETLEQAKQNNISYFNLQENKEYQERDDTNIEHDIFQLGKETKGSENLTKNLRNRSANDTNKSAKNLENLLNKYLADLDLSLLWETIPDGKNAKSELNKLLDEIIKCPEGMEMQLLEKALAKSKNKAQVFLSLMFLLDELKIAGKKQKFTGDLAELTEKYSLQESGFLFEFFDIQKNPELKGKFNFKTAENLAKLNSGEVVINELKQAVGYVGTNFNGEFSHIVSVYIKLRAKSLQISNLNVECRIQLAEILKLQKHFILAHTVYLRITMLYSEFKDAGISCSAKYVDAMTEFLGFIELALVTDATVGNLIRGFGISPIELDGKILILQELTKWLSFAKIPAELFRGAKEQQRFSIGVRTLLSECQQKSGIDTGTSLLFKNRQPSKFYI